jgi:predicted lipid-binding transport protein (Tim44 family)
MGLAFGRIIMSSVLKSFRVSARALAAASMIALAGAMLVGAPGSADARLGGGGSFGSRGSRTFSMPAPTPTAPRVSPFSGTASRPSFGTPGLARPGFFGGGFGRGLLGGFLGAGLFGMLFGSGFGGGLGGGMSFIGLLLQLGLLYLGFRFVMGFFRRQSAFGGAGMGGAGLGGVSSAFSGASVGVGGAARQQGVPIGIGPEDYQVFERRLIESQAAYSNGDVATLRRIATPEMAGNFSQELAGNARQGVVNKLSNVRLLSGDLSEAWREGGDEYATVAMKFSLIDATLEERTGRVVAGDPNVPQDVTEVWTFTRRAGSGPAGWVLSAIQQA